MRTRRLGSRAQLRPELVVGEHHEPEVSVQGGVPRDLGERGEGDRGPTLPDRLDADGLDERAPDADALVDGLDAQLLDVHAAVDLVDEHVADRLVLVVDRDPAPTLRSMAREVGDGVGLVVGDCVESDVAEPRPRPALDLLEDTGVVGARVG